MTVLGAVLAGGQSSRFGSDKALAEFRGQTLLQHAVAALKQQVADVIIVGRSKGPAMCVDDWPGPGGGPLGGIAGAFAYAAHHGFETVLTTGVDSFNIPSDLLDRLTPAPAYLKAQPVIGLWPLTAFGGLEELIFSGKNLSIRAFADQQKARAITVPVDPLNINSVEDLVRMERRHEL